MILSLYRDESPSGPDNFVALQTVNKDWKNAIWDIMWRKPPGGGLRLLLSQLGDYDITQVCHSAFAVKHISNSLPQGEVKIRDDILTPSPASWMILQDAHFQRITTLDLDFFTIRPLDIASTIAESCPQLHLPRLSTLRASLDSAIDDQFPIVRRFMQPTVTTFDLRVWAHTDDVRSPRRNQSPLSEFERLATEDRSARYDEGRGPDWPDMKGFCTDVVLKMPHISHLKFVLNSIDVCLRNQEESAAMILGLQKLETLDLAMYNTHLSFLETISSHCTLRTITTLEQPWPLIRENLQDELVLV